jgi:hypothetical protein
MGEKTCTSCKHGESLHHPSKTGNKLEPHYCMGSVHEGDSVSLCKCTRFIVPGDEVRTDTSNSPKHGK